MSTNPWFKFYGGEYLADPKIASLSAQERSCWITLLSLAGMSSTPGTIEYLTIEVLLDKSGVPFDPYNPENWNAALGVLKRFENMKMISTSEDGLIEVRNWKKRQETALTNAERQAKYRESNGKVTERVTKVTLEENRVEKKRIDTSATRIEIVPSLEESEKPIRAVILTDAKFRKVCSLFSPDCFDLYRRDTTQRTSAKILLEEKGFEAMEAAMAFVNAHKGEQFFPKVLTPDSLLKNWLNLVDRIQSHVD